MNICLQYSSLAQSVEHLTVNQVVAGSSPAGGARKKHFGRSAFFNEARKTALSAPAEHEARFAYEAPAGTEG